MLDEISIIEEGTAMENELHQLQSVVNTSLGGRKALKILDAGCGYRGYKPYISIPENAYVVGIDISEEQLLKNTVAHEKILGDIQSYELPPDEFDAIICWWVLEHASQPERALKNFLYSVKEGGIIVIAVPNVMSIKGFITKFTPFGFHKWYYRSILGYKDHLPFPTFLRFSISPAAMKRFAIKNCLSIEYSDLYEFRENNKVLNMMFWVGRQAIKLLTFGKIDAGLTEFIIVLKKQKVSAINTAGVSEREVSVRTSS
jgi:SAM-dependent methyltransferase